MTVRIGVAGLAAVALLAGAGKKPDHGKENAIDRYIREAGGQAAEAPASGGPGSLWAPGAALADLGRDLRASRVHDLVTIVVADRASAVARGTTKASRQSTAKFGISAAAGPVRGKVLPNLLGTEGSSDLQGEGTTSREMTLSTTLSARVTHVLPNGYLVIEGSKDTMVNSERQTVTVRGVVRPSDLASGNTVRSDRLAELEVRVNGKGVVGDAVKRPFFLYRLVMGLLPF